MSVPVTNCDECGACCVQQSSPGLYIGMLYRDGMSKEEKDWVKEIRDSFPEDAERLDKAPDEAKHILKQHIARGPSMGDGMPCVWFDSGLRQCRFYEHRPEVCRGLEVGGEGCQRHRTTFYIKGVPLDDDKGITL